MAVSQKQIAEKMGVSIALVSRVLSGRAEEIGIAAGTIERVKNAAREMGYVPSAAALSLKGKATRTIGVAVYDFNDPFFGALIEQIQILAHEHDYSLIMAGFLNRIPDEQDLLALHKHSIDGLIILGSDMEARWLQYFRKLPVARIGHGGDAENSVRISIDEGDAARQLVEHLAKTGRTKLLCISADIPTQRQRQTLITDAALEEGISIVAHCSEDKDPALAGYHLTQKHLVDVSSDVDALVCVTDQVAMGALRCLYDAVIKVPEDIAVTGFDDIPASRQFTPPLTTIRQPLAAMAKEAFHSIIKCSVPCEINLISQLVIREST